MKNICQACGKQFQSEHYDKVCQPCNYDWIMTPSFLADIETVKAR